MHVLMYNVQNPRSFIMPNIFVKFDDLKIGTKWQWERRGGAGGRYAYKGPVLGQNSTKPLPAISW
jgi:hypothetical protein